MAVDVRAVREAIGIAAAAMVRKRQQGTAVAEMLADPVGLAEAAGIIPDPWQAYVLRSDDPRILLNCSRQSGKSQTSAVLALHTALTSPGALVLLISRAQRQSAELLRKVLDVYGALKNVIPSDAETVLRLELANGSRIISLPGKEETIRSFSSVDLLVIDEASRVADALYYAVRPMLAVSGGRLVALSTPFGKRGWWYEAWENGGETWRRVKITADQCPRISAEFLADERAGMPPLWYAAEYDCEFTETIDQMFGLDLVESAMTADVPPLFAQQRIGAPLLSQRQIGAIHA